MYRIHQLWLKHCFYLTLNQCYLHKDLCSLELQQSGFRAAHSIKTALLEVTEGLCWAELTATSSFSLVFFPHCRLLTNSECSHFLRQGYLRVFMLTVYLLLRGLLLAANTQSGFPQQWTPCIGVPLGSALSHILLPFFMQKHFRSVITSLMVYALLPLWSQPTAPLFHLLWHAG